MKGLSRGHLLGKHLGGSGTEPGNLEPLYQNKVNSSAMYHGVESVVRDWVDSGATVYYRVEPYYQGKNPIPFAVKIVVGSDYGNVLAVIENRK